MLKKALFALTLALPATLVAQSESDPTSKVGTRFANGIAAIVEEKIITVQDIRRELQPLLPQIQEQAGNDPERFRALLQQAEDDVIQMLTDNVLIVKDFFSEKERQIPFSFVENSREEEIATRFEGDRSKFLAYLKSIGKTPNEYDEMLRDDIIVSVMNNQNRKTQTFVSPVKIEKFYLDNKQEFYEDERVHLYLIGLSQVADEDPDLLEQSAQRIIEELEDGADFSELAKKHSQDAKRRKGGDWGWVERKSLVPALADIAFELEPGEHSQPIKVGKNIFILLSKDKKEAGYIPIEDVRDRIEDILVSQMSIEAHNRWLARLRRDGYVRRFN